MTLSYIRTRKPARRNTQAHACSSLVCIGGLRGPCPAAPARVACAMRQKLSSRLWTIARFGCAHVWLLPSYGHPQSGLELLGIVTVGLPDCSKERSRSWDLDEGLDHIRWAMNRQCNSERCLALEMETLSPADGYPARDTGGLKSQFMRSANIPVRDGIANRPQVCCRPDAAVSAGRPEA